MTNTEREIEMMLGMNTAPQGGDVQRQRMIQGLRDVAAFIERNPGVPCPVYQTVMISTTLVDEMKAAARAMGSAEKEFSGGFVSLFKMFGPVKYEVFIQRELICEKTVVGTRTIPAHEEEIIEWSCSDSILGK